MQKNKIAEKFAKLAAIDSISKEERELADRMIFELQNLGCEVFEDEAAEFVGGNAGNIIANYPGDKEYPHILLCAHMDRVEPGRNIEVELKNNYLQSKGETILAADNLSGIIAILELLNRLNENKINHGPLTIILTVAEELELAGSQNLSYSHYKDADLAFVLDAEGEVGTIINRSPSQLKFNIYIEGKDDKDDIIANKIASMALSDISLGQIDRDTRASINVKGGGSYNSNKRDEIRLIGEIRSFYNYKMDSKFKEIKEILKEKVSYFSAELKIEKKVLYENFYLPPTSDIIKMAKYGFSKEGVEISLEDSCGGSDANIFNQAGVPALNIATGVQNAHSVNEKLDIYGLKKLILVLEHIVNYSRKEL